MRNVYGSDITTSMGQFADAIAHESSLRLQRERELSALLRAHMLPGVVALCVFLWRLLGEQQPRPEEGHKLG